MSNRNFNDYPVEDPESKGGLPLHENNKPFSQLMKLFDNELIDLYWFEKSQIGFLPRMIKAATSFELSEILAFHLDETKLQIVRLLKILDLLNRKIVQRRCDAINALIKESELVVFSSERGPMCDAGIISSTQKIEHYEMSSYGTLRQYAKTMGLPAVVELLSLSLEEEKEADEKMSDAASTVINLQAAEKLF